VREPAGEEETNREDVEGVGRVQCSPEYPHLQLREIVSFEMESVEATRM